MTLQELLGEDLYAQVDAKIQEHNNGIKDKVKHVRFADLSEGGYVSKEKYLSEKTRADGLEEQLTNANTEIQSYKDMDIDGIKTKAAEWETKYTTDTQALKEKLEQQTYDFEAERYLAGYKFSSDLAKKAAIQEFKEKKFKLQEGKFLGADDFMKEMKEANPTAFVEEKAQEQAPPVFTRSFSNGYRPAQVADEKAYMDQKYANNPYYKQ